MLTIRLVGVMLLMSMMSLPMMTAEVFCRRFSTMMPVSAAVAVVAGVTGLFAGAAFDVPCSAMIVIILAMIFAGAKAVEALNKR